MRSPERYEYVQLVLTMSFLAGVFKLVMGLARMGVLVNFVSQTVVIGFTAGAGFLIAGSQIQHFFGIAMPRGISFMETLEQFALHLGDIDWARDLRCRHHSFGGIAIRRRFPRFPYMIGAMVVGGTYAYLPWVAPGFAVAHHIATVRRCRARSRRFRRPDFRSTRCARPRRAQSWSGSSELTEAISIARAIAARSEQRINANQEFIGQGLRTSPARFFPRMPRAGRSIGAA